MVSPSSLPPRSVCQSASISRSLRAVEQRGDAAIGPALRQRHPRFAKDRLLGIAFGVQVGDHPPGRRPQAGRPAMASAAFTLDLARNLIQVVKSSREDERPMTNERPSPGRASRMAE